MELTREQEDKIVQKVIERVLTLMPETIGNLMANHSSNKQIKDNFFKGHPEFVGHEATIASVLEMYEGKDLSADYDKVLNNSVPEIRKRIEITKNLNLDSCAEKSNFKDIDFTGNNGAL
ncbi:MAG: hypothetical protein GY861_16755 [bacterium]|nr:hypothetical protein [bacterium]